MARVKITDYILSSIKEYQRKNQATRQEIADKLNIHVGSIDKWFSGEVKTIRENNWFILEPLIKPHLPKNYNIYTGKIELQDESQLQPPRKLPQITEVPIITIASAAGYEPAIDPFDEFIENNKIGEAVYVGEVSDTLVAIQIEGDSMSPEFPNGSIVFVDTAKFPERGDCVVARLADDGIVFKRYGRKNNIITLSSENPEGRNYEWNVKEKKGFCMYMWPCLKATIDLRQRRWEKNGKAL